MKKLTLALCLFLLATATALAQPVKLGVLMGFTGGLAALAPAIETGALLAVDQANEAGGLYGGDVESVSRDTATNPGAGRDAASKLVEIDGAPGIVGALSSGVTTAVTSVTVANQVVQISPSSTAPTLTDLDDSDYFFRTCPSDALQGRIQGNLALEQGYKTASVIYVNNPYGKGLAENFKQAFEAGGGKVQALVPYEENKPSYRGEAQQALKGEPGLMNVIAYPADGNKILVTLIEQGYEGGFIFPDGMKSGDVASGPAAEYVEGSMGTAAGSVDSPVAQRFEADYKSFVERTDRSVDPSAPYRKEAYDAMAVLILAAAAVGPDFANMAPKEQGRAIRDHLRQVTNSANGEPVGYNEFEKAFSLLQAGKKINYQGVSGPITFDGNGDVKESTFEIWKFEGGQVKTVRMEQ